MPATSDPSAETITSDETSWRLLALVGLAVATCVAAWLRWSQLHESFWVDELHTSWTVADQWQDVAPRARIGNNSPLYFWLLWTIKQVFGDSEAVLRGPSILSGVLLVPLCYFVVVDWFRSRISGLLAALLVAGDEHLLFFSIEARPYGLIQFLAVVHVYLFARAVTLPSRTLRVGLVVIGVLLYYLHYTTGLLFVAEAVAYLLLWQRANYRMQQIASDYAWIAVASLFSLPHLHEISTRRELWAAFIPADPPLLGDSAHVGLLTIFPLLTYAGPSMFCLLVTLVWRRTRNLQAARSPGPIPVASAVDRPTSHFVEVRSVWPAIVISVCWLLVPLLLAWLVTRLDGLLAWDLVRLFFRRYLVVVTCAPIVLAAGLVSCQCHTLIRISTALCVAVFAVALAGPAVEYRARGRWINRGHEDWRAAVAWVNEERPGEDIPVLLHPGLIEVDMLMESEPLTSLAHDYCLLPLLGRYRIEGGLFPLRASRPEGISADLEGQLEKSDEVWLIVRGKQPKADALRGVVLAKLMEPSGLRQSTVRQFGSHIQVTRFVRR